MRIRKQNGGVQMGTYKSTCLMSGCLILTAVSMGFCQQGAAYFRVISPTGSVIRAFSPGGTMTWTNAATVGVTCTVQRATTLVGPSNWVDYVQHAATNAVMALRLFDSDPPNDMALIPAGSYQMGDSFGGEYYHYVFGELPVHTVYVSAFYMGRHEVTKAQWDFVCSWAVTNGYSFDDNIYGEGAHGLGKAANHPVYKVSWHDCVKWCNARSEMEGRTPVYWFMGWGPEVYRAHHSYYDFFLGYQVDAEIQLNWSPNGCSPNGYRLPTEAQWEKAARGGLSNRRFPWGDLIDHSLANYFSWWYNGIHWYSYDIGYEGYDTRYMSGYAFSAPVGSAAPNGYGLYDMSGNVSEWCWDYLGDYIAGYEADPLGPWTGTYRVIRDGDWATHAGGVRVAARGGAEPLQAYDGFGFRIVLPAGP